MPTTRPFRTLSVQARDVQQGMVLTTPGGWHRHVVEVDHTSNVHGQVIIRLASRPDAHPSGSTVLHPDTYLYAVQYEDEPTTCATCGVTITWKPWPTGKPRPAWLGDRDGYWLDGIGTRGGYQYGKPQFDAYRHEHAPHTS